MKDDDDDDPIVSCLLWIVAMILISYGLNWQVALGIWMLISIRGKTI